MMNTRRLGFFAVAATIGVVGIAHSENKKSGKPAPIATATATAARRASPTLPPYTKGFDWSAWVSAHKNDAGLTTFTCPTSVSLANPGTFGPPSFGFVSAQIGSGCGGSQDLAPSSARGGPCLVCSYQNGVALHHSAGNLQACWLNDAKNAFSCESVPPPPASTRCTFTIQLPTVGMFPYSQHLRGDNDLWSDHNGVRLTLNASISRGTGADDGKLFLNVSGQLQEQHPDFTTFADSRGPIEIKDANIKDGTAADVAACFASYGKQRPFQPITGAIDIGDQNGDMYNTEFGMSEYDSSVCGSGRLRMMAHCRFDTKGNDNGKVGCDQILFDPVNVSVL
jgi:hypothetical protein